MASAIRGLCADGTTPDSSEAISSIEHLALVSDSPTFPDQRVLDLRDHSIEGGYLAGIRSSIPRYNTSKAQTASISEGCRTEVDLTVYDTICH